MSPQRLEVYPALAGRRPSLRRRVTNHVLIALCGLSALAVVIPLALIIGHLLARGLPALDLGFFIHLPKPVGEPGGGMANAIVGTAILVSLGLAIALPIGVGTGVFLAEHGGGFFGAVVRYTADVLSGVPSIVVGVATYGLVVVTMGHFSALAGGIALGLLMVPTLARSTEEVVRLVPASYRQAGLALGAPRWKVTQFVVLPAARAGILTAALLAMARAAGETAPLLFTALGNRFWSVAIDRPIASLPVLIYDYARAPYADWNRQAWTGALVLLGLVTVVSAVLRVTARRVR
jgi:phosphate transport system permease protein